MESSNTINFKPTVVRQTFNIDITPLLCVQFEIFEELDFKIYNRIKIMDLYVGVKRLWSKGDSVSSKLGLLVNKTETNTLYESGNKEFTELKKTIHAQLYYNNNQYKSFADCEILLY